MQSIFIPLTSQSTAVSAGSGFSRDLSARRKNKRLSVSTVAKKIQVERVVYRRWEKGIAFPAASERRRLAACLWANDYPRVAQLCKRARRQRRNELVAQALHKNNITRSALKSFRREHKTWLTCVKDALLSNASHLTPATAKMLRKELRGKQHGWQFSAAAVQNISAALQLNLTDMCTKIKIETILTIYQNKKEKYGDFLFANTMRQDLEGVEEVLAKKDRRALSTCLARLPQHTVASALPLTFAARLRHAAVSLQSAVRASKISPFTMKLYYHGLSLPALRVGIIKKVCRAFRLTYGQELRASLQVEEKTRRYMRKMFQGGSGRTIMLSRRVLNAALETIMADYSQLSRIVFRRRVALQLSMAQVARAVQIDADDYLELEWCMYPRRMAVLQESGLRCRLAQFLDITPQMLENLLSATTERHEERERRARDAPRARAAQLAAVAAERERAGKVSAETPKLAAQHILRLLAEQGITAATLRAFDKTFAAHLCAAGVSLGEASARCALDGTRLRQYLAGEGFPVDRASLKRVCRAFKQDVAQMEKLVGVEKIVRRYVTDTSRVGDLPLPVAIRTALAQAAEVVVAEYSEFAARLYRRRRALRITQREAAERLGLHNSNSYRKLEQSTTSVLGRNLRKDPHIMANLAAFLQVSQDELQGLFAEQRPRHKHGGAYARRVAAERVLASLQRCNLGVTELRSFRQSFAGRLRASGVSLAEACRRTVLSRSKIKPCFEGQHLPTGKHELMQFCSDFSLGAYEQVKRQLDIERALRDYITKTIRYGKLALPQEVLEVLERGVATIMSDYCELSRLLTQRRGELQMSMEAAAKLLGIKTHEYYRKLERTIDALPMGALRGSPDTMVRMAEFLQISVERLRELIAAASVDDGGEQPSAVDEQTSILREASAEIVKRLREKDITPEDLAGFEQTFAARLRATGIAPHTAAVRVDAEVESVAPYLHGERLPRDEHELQRICTAFALSDHVALQKVIDIEEVVNFYMQKISELGALPLPEGIKDPLNRVTQIIKATYSECGKLLFRKRFDLKMSLEEVAQELGIKHTQNYHEFERSTVPAQSTLLRGNPALVETIAAFLELPLAQVQKLVGVQSMH